METFGVLLRHHRMAAVLTQERLAERARIGATGIAALEAGRRKAPRATTIALLLDALDLTDSDRAELVTAAAASAELGRNNDTAVLRMADDSAVETTLTGNFPGVRRRFNFRSSPAICAGHDSAARRSTVAGSHPDRAGARDRHCSHFERCRGRRAAESAVSIAADLGAAGTASRLS
ncbi:MAG: helix-turn-helix transcriptional regulator [Ilumatobacteraceae bacterium]